MVWRKLLSLRYRRKERREGYGEDGSFGLVEEAAWEADAEDAQGSSRRWSIRNGNHGLCMESYKSPIEIWLFVSIFENFDQCEDDGGTEVV